MSTNLTQDQVEHFREVFAVFDADGSGAIDHSELGSCLRSLGQNLSEEELKELIMSVDEDQSGTIDFEEFLGMINSKTDAINCEDELLAAFQEFDIARKGRLPRYGPPRCWILLRARRCPACPL
jgi:calmodulin